MVISLGTQAMSSSPHHTPAFETKQGSGEKKTTQPKPPTLTTSVTGRKYGGDVETVCDEKQKKSGKTLTPFWVDYSWI